MPRASKKGRSATPSPEQEGTPADDLPEKRIVRLLYERTAPCEDADSQLVEWLKELIGDEGDWWKKLSDCIKDEASCGDLKKLDKLLKVPYFKLLSWQKLEEVLQHDTTDLIRELSGLVFATCKFHDSSHKMKSKQRKEFLAHYFHVWTLDGHDMYLCGADERETSQLMGRKLSSSKRTAVEPKKVTLLSAEMGNGKTHAVLTSNPGGLTLLLVPEGDFECEKGSSNIEKEFLGYIVNLVEKATSTARETANLQGMRCWSHVLGFLHSERKSVHIAIDEAHRFPAAVRYLCQCRETLSASLKKAGVFAGFQGTFRFLCAGTEICTATYGRPSDDNTFKMYYFRSVEYWGPLKAVNSPHSSKMQSILEAARGHRYLQIMESNARTAMLCLAELEKLGQRIPDGKGNTFENRVKDAVHSNAHHILDAVAKHYSESSSFQRFFESMDLAGIARASFRLILLGEKDCKYPPAKLVLEYGLVSDTCLSGNDDDSGFEPDRFQMQCIVAVIVASLLNYAAPFELSNTSGSVLERLVAQKMLLGAESCKTRTELYRFLSLQGPDGDNTFTFSNKKIVPLPYRFCGGLTSKDTKVEEESQFVGDYLNKVKAGTHAFVFINGRNAPFPDVFFVAKGAVVLIQAKDHSGGTTFGATDYGCELLKSGLLSGPIPQNVDKKMANQADRYWKEPTELLCRYAGIGTDEVVFAVVRSKPFAYLDHPESKTKYLNLCPPSKKATTDFMFPLPWPLPNS